MVQEGGVVEGKGVGCPGILLLGQRQSWGQRLHSFVAGGGRKSQIIKYLGGHAIAFGCYSWGPEGF